MKSSLCKLLLIAPSLLLSSCGFGLRETYKGVPYNSAVFEENYFNEWSKKINPYDSKNSITETKNEYVLSEEDHVFRAFNSVEFGFCEYNKDSYIYTYDLSEPTKSDKKAYGPAVKLSNYDNSFKYGVSSKLFDGQMFCNKYFQNARVQVEPMERGQNKGFGLLFAKECTKASYFMMNFKCSVVTKDDYNLPHVYSKIKLHLSFYSKNNNGYTCQPLTYVIDAVPTNSGDDHDVEPYSGRTSMYVCFGFDLKNIDTSRLVGLSLQYEKIEDGYSTLHPDQETMHAIMLYEVSFPHSTWH